MRVLRPACLRRPCLERNATPDKPRRPDTTNVRCRPPLVSLAATSHVRPPRAPQRYLGPSPVLPLYAVCCTLVAGRWSLVATPSHRDHAATAHRSVRTAHIEASDEFTRTWRLGALAVGFHPNLEHPEAEGRGTGRTSHQNRGHGQGTSPPRRQGIDAASGG